MSEKQVNEVIKMKQTNINTEKNRKLVTFNRSKILKILQSCGA